MNLKIINGTPPPLSFVIPNLKVLKKQPGGGKNCYDLSIQNGGTKRREVLQNIIKLSVLPYTFYFSNILFRLDF